MTKLRVTLIAIFSFIQILYAKPDSTSTTWIVKPEKVSFVPFQASLTEPRLGLSKAITTSTMKVDLGNSIDLARLYIRKDNADEQLYAAGIDFFTFVRVTGWEGLRLQVDAADGYFGGHLTRTIPTSHNELQLRIRFLHLSAHFIDGHFDETFGAVEDES